MDSRKLHRFPLLAFVALLILTASGCSSNTGLVAGKMDPRTSVTITYIQSPMIFYRDVSGRAAYARDFVYVAPIEINRSGTYHYYLWLGIWNTMEDARPDLARDGFESLVVFVDGEPLPLEIAGWTPQSIGASEPVYLKPVASAADAYYEVTVNQLNRIAEATDIRLQSTEPKRGSYEPWDDQKAARSGLIKFLDASVYWVD